MTSCAEFGVPREVLPEVRASSEIYGVTRGLGVLPDGIPVAGMAGDQQSALFGQACFEIGEAKCTFGTGAFLLMNTGKTPVASSHGLLTTVAWKTGDEVSLRARGECVRGRGGGSMASRRAQANQALCPTSRPWRAR